MELYMRTDVSATKQLAEELEVKVTLVHSAKQCDTEDMAEKTLRRRNHGGSAGMSRCI